MQSTLNVITNLAVGSHWEARPSSNRWRSRRDDLHRSLYQRGFQAGVQMAEQERRDDGPHGGENGRSSLNGWSRDPDAILPLRLIRPLPRRANDSSYNFTFTNRLPRRRRGAAYDSTRSMREREGGQSRGQDENVAPSHSGQQQSHGSSNCNRRNQHHDYDYAPYEEPWSPNYGRPSPVRSVFSPPQESEVSILTQPRYPRSSGLSTLKRERSSDDLHGPRRTRASPLSKKSRFDRVERDTDEEMENQDDDEVIFVKQVSTMSIRL